MAEEVSYHRRQLPEETCVSFSSAQGVDIFKRALRANTMGPYFALAEQFTTQAEPAYCGLATLVMVLNAMAIDPKRCVCQALKNERKKQKWHRADVCSTLSLSASLSHLEGVEGGVAVVLRGAAELLQGHRGSEERG